MSRPPKPTAMHEASGAYEKNPNRRRGEEPVPPDGEVVKPRLKGRASKIWDEYAPICVGMKTLSRGDEAEFATWCDLQSEYEKCPKDFQTSRLAQKRAYADRFGIAGAGSRAKLGSIDGGEKKDSADKYFSALDRSGNTVRQ